MGKKKAKSAIGSEIVRRLKRFTDALETTERLADRFTCRTVKLNLKPTSHTPEMVKATRSTLRASQTVFAQFLGVSASAVRDWEQGLKSPNGAACRLMDEIRRSPDYFFRRLTELSSPVRTR